MPHPALLDERSDDRHLPSLPRDVVHGSEAGGVVPSSLTNKICMGTNLFSCRSERIFVCSFFTLHFHFSFFAFRNRLRRRSQCKMRSLKNEKWGSGGRADRQRSKPFATADAPSRTRYHPPNLAPLPPGMR